MSLENLPPEMQARIASIMAGNQAPAESPHQAAIAQPAPQPPAPVVKPPSLVDHVVALRQEVSELKQQNAALIQATEAIGQAVGAIYQMFQPTQQPTYSDQFVQSEQTYQEDF
tara:strand:- start:323 stop:661 length:339 start_codon:yes stop_codon:yes gene_type:complete